MSKARAPGDMHPTQLQELLGSPAEKEEVRRCGGVRICVCLFPTLTCIPFHVRQQWQLIDVREPDELATADIKGAGFLNLPLSQFPQWYAALKAGRRAWVS